MKPVAEHGTRARYLHRKLPCRCAACREANAAYQLARRNRPPSEPTDLDTPPYRIPDGWKPLLGPCGRCNGRGEDSDGICPRCDGTGSDGWDMQVAS